MSNNKFTMQSSSHVSVHYFFFKFKFTIIEKNDSSTLNMTLFVLFSNAVPLLTASSQCLRFQKLQQPCLNTHSALCPSLREWVRCANHHQRLCRHRESPDCVISNNSLLLLKPWAVLVCWRRVWLLIVNGSTASRMCCTCSSAPMLLSLFLTLTLEGSTILLEAKHVIKMSKLMFETTELNIDFRQIFRQRSTI